MPRGAKPTCLCGTCKKCRRRTYQREYMREYNRRRPLTEEQRAARAAATRRWREENPEKERARWQRYQQTDQYKAYQRAYHEENRERISAQQLAAYHALDEEGKRKWRARSKVGDAIRQGRMTRGACEVCGKPDAHAHHDDYDRPLDVRWLCPKHHMELHRTAA